MLQHTSANTERRTTSCQLPANEDGSSKRQGVNEQSRGRKEMFYLTMHSTHFIYGYMASDIWLKTILIVRKETRCHHIGYSYRLTARVLLYASSHRQDNTYHGLYYTSHGALAGMRNSSMGPPHEGSIRRPIAPWANALTTELHLAPSPEEDKRFAEKKNSSSTEVHMPNNWMHAHAHT